MRKLLTTIYFVLAFSTVSLSQVIPNCSSFRTCKADRLSPTTKGSNVDYSYYRCVGGCCGSGFSACLNNTPGDGSVCGKYGCESKCNGTSPNFTGFTHTYYDCEDTLHIDTTTCQATCSTPTPTPKPSPTPNPFCDPAERNACKSNFGYYDESICYCYPIASTCTNPCKHRPVWPRRLPHRLGQQRLRLLRL